MALIDSIKACALFFELYDDEIENILRKCVVAKYKPGQKIMEEGAEGKDFFVLLSGTAKLTKNIRGKELEINELRKGDCFGETVLINENKRPTSVLAHTACDVLIIDHDTIFSTFQNNTKVFAVLILNLARMLTRRLGASNKAISAIHERLRKTA